MQPEVWRDDPIDHLRPDQAADALSPAVVGRRGQRANVTDPRDLRPFSVKANGRRLGLGTYIHVRIIRKGKVRQMSLLIFLLVVFLIALVAGWGWWAGRGRR